MLKKTYKENENFKSVRSEKISGELRSNDSTTIPRYVCMECTYACMYICTYVYAYM